MYNQEHKFDEGKILYHLIPVEILEEIAKVMTYGAAKYSPDSWKGIEAERYKSALFRHLVAHEKGEVNDKESGLSHLSHALTNLAFILYQSLQEAPQKEHGHRILHFSHRSSEK